MIFGLFTLFVALCISAVAEFYSIIGLTAIFAAEPVPVIIMGVALGIGKITAAVWLKMNWHRASITYKLYLVPAVIILMIITSMGIFGFLSRAHIEQSAPIGDTAAQIEIIEEKIEIEQQVIKQYREDLEILNQQIERFNQLGAVTRGVNARATQQAERETIFDQIAQSQQTITNLRQQRAPLAADIRKIETEVGPIKYIAAVIYGDNSDANLLESAVRWVIILIVAVFDPLALILIIAAQQSLRWAREEKIQQKEQDVYSADKIIPVDSTETVSPAPSADIIPKEVKTTSEPVIPPILESVVAKTLLEQHPYLSAGFGPQGNLTPMVWKQDPPEIEPASVVTSDNKESVLSDNYLDKTMTVQRYTVSEAGYVEVEGKSMHYSVLKDFYPDVYADLERRRHEIGLKAQADNLPVGARPSRATFGTEFPVNPEKGEMFLHVAIMPSKLHKYNGTRWIEVDKSATDLYTYNEDYLRYLVAKINQGHISLDDITESEQDQIADYLKKNA